MNNQAKPYLVKKFRILLPMLLAIILIISAGYIYYHFTDQDIRNDKYDDLKIIAQFKVNQIEQWSKERYSEAQYFSTDPTLIQFTVDLLEEKNVKTAKSSLEKSLTLMSSL